MEENIRVAIRIRPLTQTERKSGQTAVWRAEGTTIISKAHEALRPQEKPKSVLSSSSSPSRTAKSSPHTLSASSLSSERKRERGRGGGGGGEGRERANGRKSSPAVSATIATPVRGGRATIAKPMSPSVSERRRRRKASPSPSSSASPFTPSPSSASSLRSRSSLTGERKRTTALSRRSSPALAKASPSTPNTNYYAAAKPRVYSYTFDQLFRPKDNTQELYEQMAEGLVWSAMDGYNATIFAYGQTGSGKTYTMKGSLRRNPGIIPLSVQDLFEYIRQTPEREFLLRVSYFEIYNEVINDLLEPSNKGLNIRENKKKQVYVENLKEVIVLTPEQVMSTLAEGEAHRHVGATDYNELSSRSHTIFRVTIESKERDASVADDGDPSTPSSVRLRDTAGKPVRVSQLNLIDLAGSEKASDGEKSGKLKTVRRQEGSCINKSLLTLGNVIHKLSGSSGTAGGNVGHVPFRDSKLTRILEPSLGGNARIAIICTLSVATISFEETHNTLKFASRAKTIRNKAKVNEFLDDKSLIKRYRNEINVLKRKLLQVERQDKDTKQITDLLTEKQRLERTNVEMEEKLRTHETEKAELIEKINCLNKLILVSSSVSSHKFSSMMKWDGTRMNSSPVQGQRSPHASDPSHPADAEQLHDLFEAPDDDDENFLLEDSSPGKERGTTVEAESAADVISAQLEQISSLEEERKKLLTAMAKLQEEVEEQKEPSPHPAEIALEQERLRTLEAEERAERAEKLLAEIESERVKNDSVNGGSKVEEEEAVSVSSLRVVVEKIERSAKATKAALESQLLDKDLELEMQRADNEVMMKELTLLRRQLQEANLL